MPDADHLARHLALAAGDDHAVLVVEKTAQGADVEAWRRQRRGHRVGAVALLRIQVEAQRVESCLLAPRLERMALVDSLEVFLFEHPEALLQREDDAYRGSEG